MKRTLIVIAVAVVALVIFGTGFAFAQYQSVAAAGYGPGMMDWNTQDGTPVPYGPGNGMMGGRSGYGPMHDYVEQALAEKLGLTEAKVEEQLAAGKTMAQIALDNGIAEANVQTILTEVHKTALDKAVAAGVLTREQADWMLQNMQNRWDDGMPCLNGGQPGQGYGPGNGMMSGRGRGGRWNQTPQTNP